MEKTLLSVLVIALFLGFTSAQPDYSSQYDYKFNLSSVLSSSGNGYPPVAWYYMLYYSVRGNNIIFGVVCGVQDPSDWCAIGISPVGDMVGSDATVAAYNTGTQQVQVYDLFLSDNFEPSSAGNNNTFCQTAVCSDVTYNTGSSPACTNNVNNIGGNYTAAAGQTPPGYLYFTFTRPLAATDALCDIAVNVDPTSTNIIFSIGHVYANGTFPTSMQKHYYVMDANAEPYAVTFQQMPSPTPSPSTGSSPSSSPSPSRSPSSSPTPSSTPSNSPPSSPLPTASSSPDAQSSDAERLTPWLSEILELIF